MKSTLNNKNVHNINSAIMGRVQLANGTKKKRQLFCICGFMACASSFFVTT